MRKALHITGAILCGVAFMLLLGTAGSSDLDLIPFRQIVTQCVIGLLVGGIGFGIIYVTEV